MLCYQSWHEMNQDLTPVMLPILTWEKTWVESSIKKLGDCVQKRKIEKFVINFSNMYTVVSSYAGLDWI